MAWYQCMLHYGMVQRMSHYTMVPMHVTLLHDTYIYTSHYGTVSDNGMLPMHVTLWHGINACYTMAWSNACHTIPWYQCMSHYCMILIYTHHTMEWYQIMACYQCMSHYGMVSMHVTLWHGANSYHTMA